MIMDEKIPKDLPEWYQKQSGVGFLGQERGNAPRPEHISHSYVFNEKPYEFSHNGSLPQGRSWRTNSDGTEVYIHDGHGHRMFGN